MSIKARLTAVEKRMPPKPFDHAGPERFVASTVVMVGSMIGDDAEAEEVLTQYAGHLLYCLRFGMEAGYSTRDELNDLQARCAALVLFFRALPAEMRARVITSGALTDNSTTGHPWADRWVMCMARRDCRVPPDVAPEAMGTLVDLHCLPPDELDASRLGMVCNGCGLMRPLRKGDYGGSCPHCRSAAWTWTTRIHEQRHGWQDMAKAELATAIQVIEQAARGPLRLRQ